MHYVKRLARIEVAAEMIRAPAQRARMALTDRDSCGLQQTLIPHRRAIRIAFFTN